MPDLDFSADYKNLDPSTPDLLATQLPNPQVHACLAGKIPPGATDPGAALTVLGKSSAGMASSALLFGPPVLEAPNDTLPELQEAMVSALLNDASGQTINICAKLLKLSHAQRQQLNKKVEDATAQAKLSLANADNQAGNASVASWIKAVAAVIGSALFMGLAFVTTGPVAGIAMFVVFGLAFTELVNTGIKSSKEPIMVPGADGTLKQLNVSIGGLVERIVDQVAKDNPTFYKSAQDKQDAVKNWTIAITVTLTVSCMIVSGGAGAAALKAATGGVTLAGLIGTGMLAGGRITAGLADIAGGISTIIEGHYKIQLAGFTAETETARAQQRLFTTFLGNVRNDIEIYLEAFSEAYKQIDRSNLMTATNIADADKVRSTMTRNLI